MHFPVGNIFCMLWDSPAGSEKPVSSIIYLSILEIYFYLFLSVLGVGGSTEFGSSVRAVVVLNHWVTSPGPCVFVERGQSQGWNSPKFQQNYNIFWLHGPGLSGELSWAFVDMSAIFRVNCSLWQTCWCMPVIRAVERLVQETGKFEAS